MFDQAFSQWCEYFEIDPAKAADWRLTGFLIKDRQRFRRLGLLPRDLPPFQHAFCRNTDFWVYEQPSDYYSRHLALHEGTAFKDGQVADQNLDTYTPLRMEDVPELDIMFVDSTEFPCGLGEPPLIPVAPAIANAIFAASGVRVRDLPIRI